MLLRRSSPADREAAFDELQEAVAWYERHAMPRHKATTEVAMATLRQAPTTR